MKSTELARVAAAYLRMIHLGQWLSHLPLRLAYRLAGWGAARTGPLRHDSARFARYAQGIGLAETALPAEWRRVTAQQGMFFVNNFLHSEHLYKITAHVQEITPDWRTLISEQQGALVLTCHHDFHHTLFVLAGLAGKQVNFVAAPEDSGVLSPWLAPHIRRQHAYCARHFNGGRYIFTGSGHTRADVATALERGALVFSMHDIKLPGKHSHPATLFGHPYSVQAGTIEIALKLGLPIYFAMLVWSDERFAYRIECQRMNVTSDRPLDAYTSALESVVVTQPSAWHGWQWFDSFSSAQ